MRKKLPPLSCTSCTLRPHACLKDVHRKLTPVLQATAIFKRFLHLPTLSRIYWEICLHKHTHENWRNTRDWENTSPLLTCPSLILLKSLSSFTTNFCVFAKLLKWPPIHVVSQPTHFSRRRSIYFPTQHNVFLFFFVSFFYACAIYADNRPFYWYGSHIELIRFKEYYRMPMGHEHISFVFWALFRTFFLKVLLI